MGPSVRARSPLRAQDRGRIAHTGDSSLRGSRVQPSSTPHAGRPRLRASPRGRSVRAKERAGGSSRAVRSGHRGDLAWLDPHPGPIERAPTCTVGGRAAAQARRPLVTPSHLRRASKVVPAAPAHSHGPHVHGIGPVSGCDDVSRHVRSDSPQVVQISRLSDRASRVVSTVFVDRRRVRQMTTSPRRSPAGCRDGAANAGAAQLALAGPERVSVVQQGDAGRRPGAGVVVIDLGAGC